MDVDQDGNSVLVNGNGNLDLYATKIDIDLFDAINASPNPTILVQRNGNLAAANHAFLESCGKCLTRLLSGLRFGAAVLCTKFQKAGSGCGSGRSCPYCGINTAIIECFSMRSPVIRESWLTYGSSDEVRGSIFEVYASPMNLKGEQFALVTLRDVSTVNNKTCLNASLIHYLINQIWGIEGLSQFLVEEAEQDTVKAAAYDIKAASSGVLTRIIEYRTLVNAESGRLCPEETLIVLTELLENVQDQAQAKLGRVVDFDFPNLQGIVLKSDTELLVEALVNTISIADKLCSKNEPIRTRVTVQGGECRFFVQIGSVLDRFEQEAIYSRNTVNMEHDKQGLDGYLSRLLVERYLGGKVGVKSSSSFGTAFYIRLPLGTENEMLSAA